MCPPDEEITPASSQAPQTGNRAGDSPAPNPTPLVDALRRAALEQRLHWRSPLQDAFIDRLTQEFRFEDGPQDDWLELEAVWNPSRWLPAVQVRIRVPLTDCEEDAAFIVANDACRLGLSAVHFDAPASALIVQQSGVFTGYHAYPASGLACREATANALAAAFVTARACLALARPEYAPSADPLGTFTLFAITRMVRWEQATVEPESQAYQLLLEAAVHRTLVDVDAPQISTTEADPEQMDTRVLLQDWLRRPGSLDATEAKSCDATLFAVEERCRWALRNLVARPPSTRPDQQLDLLEDALSQRTAPWEGLVLRCEDVRAVLAVALDVEIHAVPESLVATLRQHIAFSIRSQAPRPRRCRRNSG